MAEIISIDTPSLGDRSYLATDGTVALVIDPQRDIDRILALASDHGVTITHVFETHIHNDYVTGGWALARQTGAAYHVAAADQVSFDRTPVSDGDLIEVGALRVRALHTPGHTFSHLSYELSAGGAVTTVFTGGSLLFGTTGRTDLLGGSHAAELASAQHASVRRLAAELPGHAAVYPTHGFGSFCSASPASGTSSTIAAERLANPALLLEEAEFVRTVLAGLDAYPAYYAHMAAANTAGPAAARLDPPPPASAAELRRRIDAGEWVADLRTRTAFAAGHLRGALGFEAGESLATYLGWLVPWDSPLTLIADSPAQLAAAQRELARIGVERLAAQATGTPAQWAAGQPLASYPVVPFAALRDRGPGDGVLLDVRLRSEWAAEHVPGAVHVPLHELPGRISELPPGRIWVHCQSGYRASVAASILDAAGRAVVLVNGDLDTAGAAGITALTAALDQELPLRESRHGRPPPEPRRLVRPRPDRDGRFLP